MRHLHISLHRAQDEYYGRNRRGPVLQSSSIGRPFQTRTPANAKCKNVVPSSSRSPEASEPDSELPRPVSRAFGGGAMQNLRQSGLPGARLHD